MYSAESIRLVTLADYIARDLVASVEAEGRNAVLITLYDDLCLRAGLEVVNSLASLNPDGLSVTDFTIKIWWN